MCLLLQIANQDNSKKRVLEQVHSCPHLANATSQPNVSLEFNMETHQNQSDNMNKWCHLWLGCPTPTLSRCWRMTPILSWSNSSRLSRIDMRLTNKLLKVPNWFQSQSIPTAISIRQEDQEQMGLRKVKKIRSRAGLRVMHSIRSLILLNSRQE